MISLLLLFTGPVNFSPACHCDLFGEVWVLQTSLKSQLWHTEKCFCGVTVWQAVRVHKCLEKLCVWNGKKRGRKWMEMKGRKHVSGLFSPLCCPSSWYWMPLSVYNLLWTRLKCAYWWGFLYCILFHVKCIITANELFFVSGCISQRSLFSAPKRGTMSLGSQPVESIVLAVSLFPTDWHLWSLSELLNFPLLLTLTEVEGSPRNPYHYVTLHFCCRFLWCKLSNNFKLFLP